MSCKCDLRTRAVGDGCRYCNPQHYIDILEDQTKDDSAEIEELISDIDSYIKMTSQMSNEIVSQQAEIDRLKGQRDRLYEELKEARDEVANQASAAHELLPYKPHRYEAYKDQLDRIDALIAEIEAGK